MSLDTLADFTIGFYIFHWIWPLYGPGNCPHDQYMALFDNDVATKTRLAHHVGSKNLRECPKFQNEKPTSRRTQQDALLPDSDGRPWTSLDVSSRSRAANDIIVTKTMWFSQTSSTKCQLYPQILRRKCPATKKDPQERRIYEQRQIRHGCNRLTILLSIYHH